MKARNGKIARLPKNVRDELNQRLEDGQQGPKILSWLNELPEVKELVAAEFEGQPINKFNLSEWRGGGFEEWRREQAQERRIERITSRGLGLKRREGGDLFEDFARIVVAELAVDLDSLEGMKDRDKRWQRLRELSREFVWLQNGYNRSRREQLAWDKWNDGRRNAKCRAHSNAEGGARNAENGGEHPTSNDQQSNAEFGARNGENEDKQPTSIRLRSEASARQDIDPPSSDYGATRHPTSNGDGVVVGSSGLKPRVVNRVIYHRQCWLGCICRDCHPEDGEYPLAQAVEDMEREQAVRHGVLPKDYWLSITHTQCDCFCGCTAIMEEKLRRGEFGPRGGQLGNEEGRMQNEEGAAPRANSNAELTSTERNEGNKDTEETQEGNGTIGTDKVNDDGGLRIEGAENVEQEGEHRTSNIEQPTSKEDAGLATHRENVRADFERKMQLLRGR